VISAITKSGGNTYHGSGGLTATDKANLIASIVVMVVVAIRHARCRPFAPRASIRWP